MVHLTFCPQKVNVYFRSCDVDGQAGEAKAQQQPAANFSDELKSSKRPLYWQPSTEKCQRSFLPNPARLRWGKPVQPEEELLHERSATEEPGQPEFLAAGPSPTGEKQDI